MPTDVNVYCMLQWKKKVEKMKAQTRFKAVGSIAKLSTIFMNNGSVNGDEEETGTIISEG